MKHYPAGQRGRVVTLEHVARGFLTTAAVTATLAFANPRSAQALTITPTFNANMSSSSINVINTAIAFYQTTYSDPINVLMAFNNVGTGLGENTSLVYTIPYGTFSSALFADRTSADDATANVASSGVDPVTGAASIDVKSANGRAIGLPTDAVSLPGYCGGLAVDGCVSLNLAATNDVVDGTPGQYNLLGVVEHEMDEVLGLGSSLNEDGTTGLPLPSPQVGSNGFISPEDLFRYSANGVRSFAHSSSCDGSGSGPTAYFSINGGATNLDGFNDCDHNGDYGDWVTHTPTQVQDAATNNSGSPSLVVGDPETRALDVIGYTLAHQAPPVTGTPEPSTLALLATGLTAFAAAGVRRRRKA